MRMNACLLDLASPHSEGISGEGASGVRCQLMAWSDHTQSAKGLPNQYHPGHCFVDITITFLLRTSTLELELRRKSGRVLKSQILRSVVFTHHCGKIGLYLTQYAMFFTAMQV